MNVYSIKFREKGEEEYNTVLFLAKNEDELKIKVDCWLKEDYSFDVDKRTLSWSGNFIPLVSNRPTVLYELNLDEHT